MECPNCEFQNTPGTKMCVRCQSRLDLATVDFVPPRSGVGLSVRAPLYRMRGRWHRACDVWSAFKERARRIIHPDVDWSMIFWSIVPGLGHMRAGFSRTGATLLAVWLGLLLGAVFMIGSGVAWLFGAGALGFHCFVYSLLLGKPLASLSMLQRLIIGVIVYLMLLLGVYSPAVLIGRGIIRVVPVHGIINTQTIRNGDVVVGGGTWLRPGPWRRGDLVFYRIDARPGGLGGNVVIEAGFGVDRIIGVAGDVVAFDGERLTVNDLPVRDSMLPIADLAKMPALHFQVELGDVAILPSALDWRYHGGALERIGEGMLVRVSQVPEDDLRSRIWWRLRPWSRFGEVH